MSARTPDLFPDAPRPARRVCGRWVPRTAQGREAQELCARMLAACEGGQKAALRRQMIQTLKGAR